MRVSPLLAFVLLLVAGCSAPGTTSDEDGPATDVNVDGSPAERTPTAGTPTAPTSPSSDEEASPTPSAPELPVFSQRWERDLNLGPQTLSVTIPPGHAPSTFLLGFRPAFGSGKVRCDGPDATIEVVDPDGAVVASARAGALAQAGAGCPAPAVFPEVGMTAGTWRLTFAGAGDIAAFLATGERAGPTGVPFSHEGTHDFTFPGNATTFVVPEHVASLDVRLRLEPRSPGEACTAGSVRVILVTPFEGELARVEMPSTPVQSACSKESLLEDVMLAPGTWRIEWRGDGALLGTVSVGLHR